MSADQFTYEVLRNTFVSIVDEMGVALMRSAMSPVITQGRDFSGAVLSAEGELIMQGTLVLPGHVGTLPYTVQMVLQQYANDIHPGDVFVTNDPHRGGTHNQDVRSVTPVFANNRIVAFVVNCAHLTDIGGALPGSFVSNACDSLAEGFMLPCVRLYREGVLQDDVLRIFVANTRTPQMNRTDILLLAETGKLGHDRLQSLIDKYGHETLTAMFEDHLKVNEANFRETIAALPDGTYEFTDYIDHDPGADPEKALEVCLDLTIQGDQLILDFSRSADKAKGAINLSLPALTSATVVALKSIFSDVVEMCAGINRAIEIKTQPGSLLHALWPAPVNGMSGTTFQRAVDLVLGAFAPVVPERVMACPSTETNLIQAGDDAREDSIFDDYIQYNWTEGGYGARSDRDNGSYITLFASGSTNQSIEIYELLYPIYWQVMELIPDSGGPGKFRGGLGVNRRVRLEYGEKANTSSFGDRERHAPWGICDGKKGGNHGFVINKGTDREFNAGIMSTGAEIKKGDTYDYWSGGGGGFGNPMERDPQLVLEDVRDNYVTVKGALRDYGVVVQNTDSLIFADWSVDLATTAATRAEAVESP